MPLTLVAPPESTTATATATSTAVVAGGLPPDFLCSWTRIGPEAASVRLEGELDIATTPQLVRTLSEPRLQTRLLVLDLRALAFMDCAGMHAIVNASAGGRTAHCRLVVLRGPPNVDRVFSATGNGDAIEVHDLDSVEPALQVLLRLAEDEVAAIRALSP